MWPLTPFHLVPIRKILPKINQRHSMPDEKKNNEIKFTLKIYLEDLVFVIDFQIQVPESMKQLADFEFL